VLQELSVQTYYDTFKKTSDRKDMQQYLDTAFPTRKLMDELKNPNCLFYLAYWDSELVGYMKLNLEEAQTDVKDPDALEIERFYVLKWFQRNKIGSRMMEKALEVAKEYKKSYLWLGVWEHNHKAQRFYQHAGFRVIGQHPFQMGSKMETDLLMRKDLMEQAAKPPAGGLGPGNSYGL
jgi:ribosomal protein S18 acetylase RimI-like enzyme